MPSMVDPQVTGVGLSLSAAFFWAASPMFFASAGRRIGSFHVVLLRSLLASIALVGVLTVYGLTAGWPAAPTRAQLGWLAVSGLFGMGIGDVLIYESWVLLGVRRAVQVQTLAPLASVLLAWVWLGERLSIWTLAGTAMVLAGTSYAVLARQEMNGASREPGRVSAAGLMCGAAGAICVGIGAVTARHVLGDMNTLLATMIRVASAAVILWMVPVGRRHARQTLGFLRDRFVLSRVLPGTFVGPFAGMLCYLGALKRLEAGPASTLVAMSPLFVLPMVALRYRARIGIDVIAASIVAVGGVALICLR